MEQTTPSYVYFTTNNTLVFESLQPHIVILTCGRSTLSRFNITTEPFHHGYTDQSSLSMDMLIPLLSFLAQHRSTPE